MAQANTKKQASGNKEGKKPLEVSVYLGPPVASPEVHLAPGTVFKKKPKLPGELSFLSEWFFPVDKDLSRIRRKIRTEGSELNRKYREAMKKVGEYMRKKREA